MEKEQKQPDTVNTDDNSDSLETQTTVVENGAGDSANSTENIDSQSAAGPFNKKKKSNPIKGIAGRINIYLLLFVFVLVLAGVVTGISFVKNQQATQDAKAQIQTEPLSQEALDQLRQTDVKVGDPKQILSVESNAIFAGKVLIRDTLEVAGEIKAGAPLSLPGITVTGTSIMNQVQTNILQVSGEASIQGQLNVQSNLSVSGSGSFGGTLTAGRLNIQDLQVSGDLQLTRHIDAGGGVPTASGASALGSGGTTSISGTDTAGTVAVNTGGGTGPGCFANITFNQRYNGTPHVVITPVGSAGGQVNYYINRSSTGFSICTSNAAPTGQSFAFDYIVID